MQTHVKVIGIVHIILCALGTCVGILLFAAAGTIAGMLGMAVDEAAKSGELSGAEAEQAAQAAGMFASMGTAIFGVCAALLIIFSLLDLFAGLGCLKLKGYGRVLAIILGILRSIGCLLSLISVNIPGILIGGFGIYALVIMFNGETAKLFANGGAAPAPAEG